jgi:hypothetical protein
MLQVQSSCWAQSRWFRLDWAPKRPRPMNKATTLLWPDQGKHRSWADLVNNFGPAREESSNGHWVCWAGLNQAWEVTFQPQPSSTAKANSAASLPLEPACHLSLHRCIQCSRPTKRLALRVYTHAHAGWAHAPIQT